MQKGNKGTLRLQREAKMAKKDIDTQIKKNGKITDNFICIPDPEDMYTWWYVIFGLEGEYKGGYYIGKVVCPDTYPKQAPRIDILTDNGHFITEQQGQPGICLSISNHHPESWNPAWKVN